MQTKITERWLSTVKPPTTEPQALYFDTETTGFYVVVGKTGIKTFMVRGRAAGVRAKAKVGIAGRADGRDDGRAWNVLLARLRAKELLGEMAGGANPNAGERRGGPTWRDALTTHLSNMRKKECSVRSLETIEKEVLRLLSTWLDRPIVDMRGADLVQLHDKLTAAGKPHLANRVARHVSALWNAADKVHDLDGKNPAKSITRNPSHPKRRRIDDLPSWFEKVQTLSPVRRDLRTFCLFTGMRDEAARTMRWEHLDEDRGALAVPKPKGGEDRAFDLPLAPGVLAMLIERRKANAADPLLEKFGGDQGWCWPSLSRDLTRVQPVQETKERRRDASGKRVLYLTGQHDARREFLSVANDIGISELDRSVLCNHSFGSKNVNESYIRQSFPHLLECASRIELALWERIKAKSTKRAKLRAV